MFRVRQLLATAALLVICGHSSLQAQLPQTRIYSVFPPGGQTGQTFEVTIMSGEDTDELKSLHFTHPGITAVPKTQEVEGKPQPVDNVFVVTIAADVPPGVYEVAAEGRFGGSNTRRFVVGSRPARPDAAPLDGHDSRPAGPIRGRPAGVRGRAGAQSPAR